MLHSFDLQLLPICDLSFVYSAHCNFLQLSLLLILRVDCTKLYEISGKHKVTIIGAMQVCFSFSTNCCNSIKRWHNSNAWLFYPRIKYVRRSVKYLNEFLTFSWELRDSSYAYCRGSLNDLGHWSMRVKSGVARGCSGCTCTPGRRKNLGVIHREIL